MNRRITKFLFIIAILISFGFCSNVSAESCKKTTMYARRDSILRKRYSKNNKADNIVNDGIVVAVVKGTKLKVEKCPNEYYYKVKIDSSDKINKNNYLSDKEGYILKTNLSEDFVEQDKKEDKSLKVSEKTLIARNAVYLYKISKNNNNKIKIKYPTVDALNENKITVKYNNIIYPNPDKTLNNKFNDNAWKKDYYKSTETGKKLKLAAKDALRMTGYNFLVKGKTNTSGVYYMSCSGFVDSIMKATFRVRTYKYKTNPEQKQLFWVSDYVKTNSNKYYDMSSENEKMFYKVKEINNKSKSQKMATTYMQTGDILAGNSYQGEGHVMLYIGDGIIVHSTGLTTDADVENGLRIDFANKGFKNVKENYYTLLGNRFDKSINLVRLKKGIAKAKRKFVLSSDKTKIFKKDLNKNQNNNQSSPK
ncbi:MAG: NlpC/P60 family protein [bacterium]|nr:NlpC/P60 family protein [bacterium]